MAKGFVLLGLFLLCAAAVIGAMVYASRKAPRCICNKPDCGWGCWSE